LKSNLSNKISILKNIITQIAVRLAMPYKSFLETD
jgi:hypothetical protein